MVSLKLSTLGPEIRKNWGVGGSLLIFMVAYEYFRTRRMVWQRFAKIGLGTSKNLLWEKKQEHSSTGI